MSDSLSSDDLMPLIGSGAWRTRFGDGALSQGDQLVRSRSVTEVRAEALDGHEAEITGTVTTRDGEAFTPAIAVWSEGSDALALESDCRCPIGTNCEHAAALLAYLAKGGGACLERAFGGAPESGRLTNGKTLDAPKGSAPETSSSVPTAAPNSNASTSPTFLFRLERRDDSNPRLGWLPERFGQAYAVYEGHRVPLSPAGHLPPIVTPEGKIARDRARETEALKTLYALHFLPGAEKRAPSLKRIDPLPIDGEGGTLWKVDAREWPHPEFFWQRFHHEGVPALECRGWEVRFASDFGFEPLVFRASSWRAEIVEEGRGWFHLSAGFEIEGESFELQPILAALVSNRFLEVTEGMPAGQEFMIFLPDGRGLALPVGRFRRILQTLGELMEFQFRPGEKLRLGTLDAALLAGESGEGSPTPGETGAPDETALPLEVPESVSALSQRLAQFDRVDPVATPPGLEADLRHYQLDGYRWMQFLARFDLSGILADDMGLGKTLQTLTHLLAEKTAGHSEGRPSLVIAPTSVVENWQRESDKFTPDLDVLVLQGADRRTRFRRIAEADLVLTSYALIARDLETFLGHRFHLLVLDEAQHIKNPAAQVGAAVRRLRADHRLCLSGTPVENHLGELWSLMDFLLPGHLGSQDSFNRTYRHPIEKNGNEATRAALARRIAPLILRRTKHDVAKELPPKTEILHPIAMSDSQKDLYETVRSTMDKQVRQALAIQGTEARIVFLDALLKLRQICCHPRLLDERHASLESAKFEHLVSLLETFRREGNRVLLFSQFTSMLTLIEAHLQSEDYRYLKLTGETQDRQTLVDRFQGGEGEVFLISLKAGGTGLTLTGADIVIHYDPWWNPAAENQATDRAYRIGQDKPVFVHKLICRDTVEERIQQMQQRKDDLASDLLSGATRGLDLTPETMAGLLAGPETDSGTG